MSRFFDDLPPIATDQELLDWADQLLHAPRDEPMGMPATRSDARPLVADPDRTTLALDELLLEIEERATEVYARAHA